jgi:hypothetical protein
MGRYVIKLEWKAEAKDYYAEVPLFINKN